MTRENHQKEDHFPPAMLGDAEAEEAEALCLQDHLLGGEVAVAATSRSVDVHVEKMCHGESLRSLGARLL